MTKHPYIKVALLEECRQSHTSSGIFADHTLAVRKLPNYDALRRLAQAHSTPDPS
jgi:hypothetical protein